MIDAWLDEIEAELRACLCHSRGLSPSELAERLGVSERCVVSYLCLLATDGRIRIDRVSLSEPPEGEATAMAGVAQGSRRATEEEVRT